MTTTAATTVTKTGLTGGVVYKFKIAATNKYNTGVDSSEVVITAG